MTKSVRDFKIELKIQGPVLTKSSSPSAFGIDASVARGFAAAGPSAPCLPGTLVRGKVREALEEIGETVAADTLFGVGAVSGGPPTSGVLILGDCNAAENPRSSRQHRIAIEPQLGSARGEMLRTIETPFAPGAEVKFLGNAYTYGDDAEADARLKSLDLGLKWLTQIGSLRTTGFGRVLEARATQSDHGRANLSVVGDPESLEIEIRPRGPLCITRPRHSLEDNLFESDDVIPGAMLAGAIMRTAQALGIAGNLEHFDLVRFRHAFPTTTSERPPVVPLSTVKVGYNKYDVAAYANPILIEDADGRPVAPAFAPDWKVSRDVLRQHGWARPSRELRVRTAIDSTLRTADTGSGSGGRLFAWEMIHPHEGGDTEDGDTDDNTDKTDNTIVWRTRIDLASVPDRRATTAALLESLSQLGFVSKTKARCDVAVGIPPAQTAAASTAPTLGLADGDKLVLVLQTPALLADPRFQDNSSGAIDSVRTSGLYRSVWSELSSGSLDLSHHFSSQRLTGGEYMAAQFQRGSAYVPWLLTNEGSVFAFTVRNHRLASERLEEWITRGLPVPRWVVEQYDSPSLIAYDADPYRTNWKRCPYRPENGYGEIAVHNPLYDTPVPARVGAEP